MLYPCLHLGSSVEIWTRPIGDHSQLPLPPPPLKNFTSNIAHFLGANILLLYIYAGNVLWIGDRFVTYRPCVDLLLFYLSEVLKRFLDIDHLISLIVTVPKRDTQRTAEATITNVREPSTASSFFVHSSLVPGL